MDTYMIGNQPLDLDPTNLVAMRCDLQQEQFDRFTFVIDPKCGELRVHFVKNVLEVGNYYHNSPFNHNHVSLPLLFARFAFQIIKLIPPIETHMDGDDSGNGGSGEGSGGIGGGNGGNGGSGGGNNGGDGGVDGGGNSIETRRKKRKEAAEQAERSGVMKKGLQGTDVVKKADEDDEIEIGRELDADAKRGLYIHCSFFFF
jgi:hypothetical protein